MMMMYIQDVQHDPMLELRMYHSLCMLAPIGRFYFHLDSSDLKQNVTLVKNFEPCSEGEVKVVEGDLKIVE